MMRSTMYLIFERGGVEAVEHRPEEGYGVPQHGLGPRGLLVLLRVVQPHAHGAHEARQNAQYLAVGEALQAQVVRKGECEGAGEVAEI